MARRRGQPRLKSAEAMSAGGVLYREGARGFEVVLVGRSVQGTWGLPKGTPDDAETIEQTALREVKEETGIQPTLVQPIGSIQYYFVARSTRYHKTVHFFLMRANGGSIDQHDHEYDLVQWFTLDDAIARLSYPNEAEIVRKARAILVGAESGSDAPNGRAGGTT
ncbi:MAG TPA: NUDIX hydrolase [Chloroflexota bacterium]|nr:NUDIX hydrolase [Chloroflexota bacterium]